MLMATRIWKRDGSKDRMSLEAAAANLQMNASARLIREAGVSGIRIRLVAGDLLDTPLALFRLG